MSLKRPRLIIEQNDPKFSEFTTRYTHIEDIIYSTFCVISMYYDTNTNKKVIVKKNKSFDDYHMIINEINCLQRLNHSNIINMINHYIDDESKSAIIVLEYIDGFDMFDFRQKNPHSFTENIISIFIKELLETIKYCHTQGVCHRDIKLENIMIINCCGKIQFKLIDFGLSIISNNGSFNMNQICGSPNYIPPEILLSHKDYFYNEKCDIWNIGVVAYCLLFNMSPFGGKTDSITKYNIIKNDIIFNDDVRHISDEMKDLITQLLCKNPSYRITIDDALKHPAVFY